MKKTNWKGPALLVGFLVASNPVWAATDTWVSATIGGVNNTTNNVWSYGGNWSGGTAPSPTAGDDVVFAAPGGTATQVPSTIDTPWTINSLTFSTVTNPGVYILSGLAANTLTIGAGGIVNQAAAAGIADQGGSVNLNVNLILGANQTWSNQVNNARESEIIVGNGSNGNLSGTGNLTKAGVGWLIFSNGSSTAGSAGAWTGQLILAGGTVELNGASQLTRLGTTMTMDNTTAGTTAPTLAFNGLNAANTNYQFTTAINFVDGGTSSFAIQNLSNAVASPGVAAIDFTGALTGALAHTLTFIGTPVTSGAISQMRLQGDGSGLTYTGTGKAIAVQAGFLYLDSANALGVNNGLSIQVGQTSSTTMGSTAGLFTTTGHNVTGNLTVAYDDRGFGSVPKEDVYLGLDGAGAATYSGAVQLATTSSTTAASSNVHLNAVSGGKVTFSGLISDQTSTSTVKVQNVYVDGGGAVVLSNASGNLYSAATTVGTGTTLLATNTSGSATGSGAVNVGYNSTALTTTAASTSTSVVVSSTAGLVVGQAVSGTGIAAGSVIVGINASTSTILLSQAANIASGASFTAAASTGAVLGGTGIVTGPVTAAGSNSTFTPGANGVAGILTLSGGLSALAGATFNFEIDGSTASKIDFGSGALTLGGTETLNFTTTSTIAIGTPLTVFSGTGNWTAGSPAFQINALPGGYALDTTYGTGGYLWNTATDSLTVQFAAVPEPGPLALLSGAAAVFLAFSRLRRRRLA